MLNDSEENGKELPKTVTKDNDGHESVAEYYEKKKAERKDTKEQELENKNKKENGNTDEEVAKTVIQGVGTVMSAIPHYASFALGAMTGGGFKTLIDELKKLKGKQNG